MGYISTTGKRSSIRTRGWREREDARRTMVYRSSDRDDDDNNNIIWALYLSYLCGEIVPHSWTCKCRSCTLLLSLQRKDNDEDDDG